MNCRVYLFLFFLALSVSAQHRPCNSTSFLTAQAVFGGERHRSYAAQFEKAFSFNSLLERQSKCEIPTDIPCGGEFCCPNTDSCCLTDCCPLGDAGICCDDSAGGCCATDENCVASVDKCCPKNAQTCGGDYCWQAGSICCNGGEIPCAGDQSCCGSGCCDSGATCCKSTSVPTCCGEEVLCCGDGCCNPGLSCCSNTTIPTCCGEEALCCGDGCCNTGSFCCENDSCCLEGQVCCPGTCCPEGSECSEEYGYCLEPTTTSGSTLTSTISTVSRSSPTTTSAPKLSTPKISSSFTSSSTISTVSSSSPTTTSTPKLSTPKISSTSTSSSTSSCLSSATISQPTSSNLPTMEFIYVAGVDEDVPTNICLGIAHKLGHSAQQIVLTYAGDGEACSRSRGSQSGCSGCCPRDTNPVYKTSGPYAGKLTSCDEFPFKSTAEGGNGAWISCIDGLENTVQGWYLRSWYSANVSPGDQFIVKVTGLDCTTVNPSDLQGCGGIIRRKRNGNEEWRAGISELVQREDLWKRDSLDTMSGAITSVLKAWDNSSNIVVVPLGDLDIGSFSTDSRMLSGTLTNISVIDNDGQMIFQPGSIEALYSDRGLFLNWLSDGYMTGVGIVGVTEDTSVNLSYNFATNATASSAAGSVSASTSASPSPTTTPKSMGTALEIYRWSLVLAGVAGCAIAFL